MKIVRFALRSLNDAVSLRSCRRSFVARSLSTNAAREPFESADEFEKQIFGGHSGNNSASSDAFFQKLDRLERAARDRPGVGARLGGRSMEMDELDESFDTLSDGMDAKLQEAANYFEFDPDETEKEGYSFRPDDNFSGNTYDIRDLDLTKPALQMPPEPDEFDVCTEEVLIKADFRNVRFLANFITEAGIIIKRSKTGISAKAQRKVAREIKTARAFGLMPFTTMGTKSFIFGKTMEDKDADFEYESLDSQYGSDEDGTEPL